ncbi:MAG: hypothetical protein J0I09_01690 [Sphingobacteriia bacterium]|nr:hypothetical protein [Sphingobacteriia bacterium]
MNISYYLLIVASSTVMGFILSYTLVWCLLHPSQKRKAQYAQLVAGIIKQIPVKRFLGSFLEGDALLKSIGPELEKQVDYFLRVKLAEKMPMISMFIGEKTIGQMKEVLMAELNNIIPSLLQQLNGQLDEKLNLEKVVVNKMMHLSTKEFSQTVKKLAFYPINLFLIWGAVTGFVIGLLDALLIYLVH